MIIIRNVSRIILVAVLSLIIFASFNQERASAAVTPNPTNCDSSKSNGFLGLPYWYKYLDHQRELDALTNKYVCKVKLNGIKDTWLVAAAVIELLVRIASMIAIGIIIYGGVSYIISEGSSDKAKKAQSTVINGVIGLVITVVAAAVISFIAGRFS